MKNRPILAITMGDPCGIGAEIAVKALSEESMYEEARPLIIGDKERIRQSLAFVEQPLAINIITTPDEAIYEYGTLDVLHMEVPGVPELGYGTVNALAGEAAVTYIYKSIDLAKARQVDAVVTGPINKESMHMAGHHYPGHTEIFAQRTDTKDYAMMLSADGYFVIHVSTHCSLREACNRAKKERVKKVIQLAHELVTVNDMPNKNIGIAGLNPHSGENGAFGTEEVDEIIPAMEESRQEIPGIQLIGPVPPDSLFVKANRNDYRVMAVMYHDQGHIPMKIINFDEGVNVTLGLPIIRTSVDHGTAFGKAGKGTASARSLHAAIALAIEMALNKFYKKEV